MEISPPPNLLCQQLLPDELIAEILSWLPVKTLLGLRCVSKSLNILITSNPSFIKSHHRRSVSQKPQLLLQCDPFYNYDLRITPFPVSCLIDNMLTTLCNEPCYRLMDNGFTSSNLIGSCNGLICIHSLSLNDKIPENWLFFWNPATRLLSEKLGNFHAYAGSTDFAFGYDNSTNTYKVVCFDLMSGKRNSQGTSVKVFTLGDNIWRDIQCLPVDVVTLHGSFNNLYDGVNLSGTLNWIALRDNPTTIYDPEVVTVEKLMILSLDLGTEKYTRFSLPKGFDKVPFVVPKVEALMDCLCFCHVWEKTYFVIWQMKEFGVENSWAQLFKISYQELQIQLNFQYQYQLVPLCIYNGHTLILAYSDCDQAIIFNMRDNRVERTRLTNNINWSLTLKYTESLVSPY